MSPFFPGSVHSAALNWTQKCQKRKVEPGNELDGQQPRAPKTGRASVARNLSPMLAAKECTNPQRRDSDCKECGIYH